MVADEGAHLASSTLHFLSLDVDEVLFGVVAVIGGNSEGADVDVLAKNRVAEVGGVLADATLHDDAIVDFRLANRTAVADARLGSKVSHRTDCTAVADDNGPFDVAPCFDEGAFTNDDRAGDRDARFDGGTLVDFFRNALNRCRICVEEFPGVVDTNRVALVLLDIAK